MVSVHYVVCVWWGVCEWCVSVQYVVSGWMSVCVCGGADTGCVTWREALGGEGLSPRGAVRIGKVKGLAARVAERRRAARRPEQSRSGGEAGV